MKTIKNGFMLKQKLITVVAVLMVVVGYGQVYTDQQIGFDRVAIKKEMMSGGFVKEAFVDNQIDELRKSYVDRYILGLDKWIESQKPKYVPPPKMYKRGAAVDPIYNSFQNCESFTFNDPISPLNGWRLMYNVSPFGYNDSFEQGSLNITQPGFGFVYDDDQTVFVRNNRFQVFKPSDFAANKTLSANTNSLYEPYLNAPPLEMNIENVVRIGNRGASNRKEMMRKTFVINSLDDFILYNYAIILEDPGHSGRPFYSIQIQIGGNSIPCSVVNYEADKTIPGFNDSTINTDVKVRNWSTNIIKPADFGAVVGQEVTIEVAVSDCGAGGHFGYGYFDIKCVKQEDIVKVDKAQLCLREQISFSTQLDTISKFYWKIKDSNGSELQLDNPYARNLNYLFTSEGKYTVELNVPYFTTSSSCGVESVFRKEIIVNDCYPCLDCTSFDLSENKPYLITGWVKVGNQLNPTEQQYKDALVQITFTNADNQLITPNGKYDFKGSGSIIDGWQRVIGEFQVPKNTTYIAIDLTNTSTTNQDVYFDDIRVIPSEANMKSFVYDQQSQRLMSELDENNYATFYEYDKEGGLIRIKKETERGVYTIQETRSSNRKID